MMDDMTQMIKEKLLEDLIHQMSEGHANRMMPPKGLGVEVQASDKDGLEDGLDKAKSVLAKAGDADEMPEHGGEDEGSDEERLMQLLGDDDDEDEKY